MRAESVRRIPPSATSKLEGKIQDMKEKQIKPEPKFESEPSVVEEKVVSARIESTSEQQEQQVPDEQPVIPDLATELLHVGVDHEVLENLKLKIRAAIADMRRTEYRKEEADVIEDKIAILSQLLEEFSHQASVPFHFDLLYLIHDTITEFYYVMEHHREREALGIFYDENVSLALPDIKPIHSMKKAVQAWTEAFEGTPVEYSVTKIDIDIPTMPKTAAGHTAVVSRPISAPAPAHVSSNSKEGKQQVGYKEEKQQGKEGEYVTANDDEFAASEEKEGSEVSSNNSQSLVVAPDNKMSILAAISIKRDDPATQPKRYDAFVTVTSRLKVDTDSPRKIMEMFEMKRVVNPLPSPVHTLSEGSELFKITTIYPCYQIIRHVFVVQDARPLYCFPFQHPPRTRFDNWENKFRPDDWEEMQSIASTATKVSLVPTIKDDQTRAESALDEDDDGSSVMSGGPSGLPSLAPSVAPSQTPSVKSKGQEKRVSSLLATAENINK